MMMTMKKLWHYIRRIPTQQTRRIYLDYAAATPLLPEVAKLMDSLHTTFFGNPSAVHQEGAAAKRELEASRTTVARTLQVKESEIIFTASGTEANNLAISGYIKQLVASGRAVSDIEIITTAIEHPSILAVFHEWEVLGVTVVYIPVDDVGRVHGEVLKAALTPRTALVSIAYANSEIGTVQAVRRLARVIQEFAKEADSTIVFHCDASQAPLWLPCQPTALGVDMLTLDTGKCNGPKGLGVLVVRGGVLLHPVIHGGGQERGLRAGTENVPLIAGGVVALVRAQEGTEARAQKVYVLAQELRAQLKRIIPDIIFNGPEMTTFESLERLPHNVHVSLPGIDTEFAVVVLDSKGIAASTKSACSGAGGGESTVVLATSADPARAASTIRFTIDPQTAFVDMQFVAQTLSDHIAQMRLVDRKPN